MHILGASAHEKIFQIAPAVLAVKLDKGRVLGGGGGGEATTPHGLKLTCFTDHEDDIQSFVWSKIASRYITKKVS